MTTEIKLTDEQCDALGVERGSEVISYKTSSNHTLSVHPPKPKQWEPDFSLLTEKDKEHEQTTKTLLAYVAEFDKDWEADWDDDEQEKYYVIYNHAIKKWTWSRTYTIQFPGNVYMSEQCVRGLIEKLNSEEVSLDG